MEERSLLKLHTKGLKMVLSSYITDHNGRSIKRNADEALRKYSTMLQISEDGQEFTPVKGSTVICPHKTMLETLKIPSGITHLKFTHPKLRLKSEFNQELFESNLDPYLMDDDEEYVETEDENILASQTFQKIWKEFYDIRVGIKPIINRTFSLERILGFVQEIYDYRWILEEQEEKKLDQASEEDLPSFVDFFYDFMEKRYQVREVALKVIHDVFTALQLYELDSLTIQIFTRHLSGEEDVVWKYLALARKLISKSETIDMQKYRSIIQIMYPSRT
ncbi:hypothetical protein HK096_010616, partial [Nowakowskiella sp. JEL0078]